MIQRLLELDAGGSRRLGIAERPGLVRSLAAFLAHSGDSWFWLIGLALVWLLGTAYWRERAIILAAGILVTAVLVLAIKFTVRRRRPEGKWGNIYRSTDPHSFPSGHAARAFLLAVLAASLGPAWLGAVLWLWAPLVTLARVAMGVHYLSDVLAGALLGVFMGLLVFRLFY
ncbi:MAG TPA: phosphatase PAP2 family protein [Anaerolineales bacterium]